MATRFQESYPALSPDGRWLLFVSDQSGRREVYLRRLEGEGGQTQVLVNGGDESVWARSGREFFHRETVNDQTTLVAVGLDLSGTLNGDYQLYQQTTSAALQRESIPSPQRRDWPGARNWLVLMRSIASGSAIVGSALVSRIVNFSS